MPYNIFTPLTPSAQALTNMGTTLNHLKPSPADRTLTRRRLALLTSRELEICLLHFVDQRPQSLVAQWLGLNRATVVEHLESAMKKVPELLPLRTAAQTPAPKVHIRHLSQLSHADRERGPFNSDEL